MSIHEAVSQRDLRLRSKEIMDALEHGQAFTVTRDGHEIGELVPLARRRRFVARDEFARASKSAPTFDVAAFRAQLEAEFDGELDDPYAR